MIKTIQKIDGCEVLLLDGEILDQCGLTTGDEVEVDVVLPARTIVLTPLPSSFEEKESSNGPAFPELEP